MPFRAEHVPVDREYLRRAADRGEIVRLIRGVYVGASGVATTAVDHHLQRALAYQMHFPTPIVASHETAAAALGLPLLRSGVLPDQPRFILDPGHGSHRHRRPRIRVVPLPAHQCQTVAEGPFEGLRVTTPERTALDLAAELPLPEGLMALDFVARRRALCHVDPMALRGEVADEVTRDAMSALLAVDRGLGRRGARRRRIALALTDPRHESPAESASVGHMFLAGFPMPEVQVRFSTCRGERFLDFYWPEWRVGGECDGALKYRGGDSAEGQRAADSRRVEEKRRAMELEREHGLMIVPWLGYEALYRPTVFLSSLANALRLRGAQW